MTSLAQRSAPARLALALWDRAVSIYDLAKTVISYDPRGVVDLLRVLGSVKRHGKRLRAGAPWNLLEEWRAAVDDAPDVELARRADECDGQLPRVTYAQADAAADEVAKWLADEPPGAVALLCHSSCEFLILLIGCLKARRPAALVNTSLEGNALWHALSDALGDARAAVCIAGDARLFRHARAVVLGRAGAPHVALVDADGPAVGAAVKAAAPRPRRRWWHPRPEPAQRGDAQWGDVAAYMYTSGTTGFPKAAKVAHVRCWAAATACSTLCRLRTGDAVYNPLPLFHATGGLLGVWGSIRARATLVLRRKFSARAFVADAAQCDGCLYVGEVCRFVVDAAPPDAAPPARRLRFAFGNGMPRDGTWDRFKALAGVDRVIEFYASTEGNVNIFNNLGRRDACGVVPRALAAIYPVFVARLASREGGGDARPPLLRNEAGFLVPCAAGEAGELLGRIDSGDPSRRFDGYTDAKASAAKVVGDVRRKGDEYFRSGDLVVADREGFFYFVDRVGATFRWKGENVATTQVQAALLAGASADVAEAVVYGCRVPGKFSDLGRCGMAAIVLRPDASPDWRTRLYASLAASGLPAYARPVFVRVVDALPTTASHKYTTVALQTQGVEASADDAVFVRDTVDATYRELDEARMAAVVAGESRYL